MNPNIRIPRTYKRFAGLMGKFHLIDSILVQLLHKEKVRNSEGDETLMKVLHSSLPAVLPVDSRRFGTCTHCH